MNYDKQLKRQGIDISKYEYPDLKPGDQDWRWVHKYPYEILAGNIPSCKKIQWAALRHFLDLHNSEFYFDDEAAKSIVLWFKFCPIIKGPKAGQPTQLDPAQIFIAGSVIAWKWSEDKFEIDESTGIEIQVRHAGKRRYNQMYAQVSRKWGKTTFTAGLILYLMFKYGYGPRAYSLATKRDQAKEVWKVAHSMIKLSPRLGQIFEPRANDILMPNKGGEFKPLASDSNRLDGLDLNVACLDECHAIKDRNLYGVIISAFGANEGGEFLFAVITTAGFILDGLCTDLYKNGNRVLDPNDPTTQDNYFYAIFEIDPDDDWSEERNWFKSNPSLVYGRPSLQYMRDRFQEAVMSVEEKANFLTKHCNIFVNGSDKWLDITEVKANRVPNLDIENFRGRKAYAGLDRAQVHDICSFCVLIPDDIGGADVFWVNLLPKKTVDTAGDYLKSVYVKAIESGDLRVVMTPTVRDEDVKRVIAELDDMFELEMVSYDPWHMREIAEELEGLGYPMLSVSQGTGNMSEPAKKVEGLIKEKMLRYDSNLFEAACSCALVNLTRQNNLQVYRDNPKTDKIDPLISLIITMSAATLGKVDKNVYDERGLLIF